jgi:PAS domain S-box-containing protein
MVLGFLFRRSEVFPLAASLMWPPAGIALGLTLLLGLRVWPGVVAGAIIEPLIGGVPVARMLGSAAGISAEVLLPALVLPRFGFQTALRRVRDVLLFLGVAVVGGAFLGSLINAGYLVLAGHKDWSEFVAFCLSCYRGDALALLTLTPLVITWGVEWQSRRQPDGSPFWLPGRAGEAAVLFCGLILTGWLGYHQSLRLWQAGIPPHLLMFPFLFWAGLRLGPPGSAAANLLVVILAARGILQFSGELSAQTSQGRMALLWAIMGISSVASLLFAAVVSQRTHSEAALQVSEEKFAKAWRASPDSISISTLDEGRYVSVNEGFTRLLGYAPEEAVGRTVFDLSIWEDAAERQRLAQSLREHGRASDLQVRMRHKNGHTVIAEVSAEKIELDGQPCLLAFSKDITERTRAEDALRASEEKFAKAFRASPVAITLSTVQEGRFLEVNDGFLRMTGYRRDEVIGRRGVELNLWENAAERERISAELEKQREVRDCEARIRKKNGEVADTTLSAEIVEVGGVPCLLVVSTDVTERKLLEAQLRQSQKMEAVGQLAGGVAHDFNNLLGVIIGYADMLIEELEEKDPRARKADAILRAAQRAANLTRQLLAFSRKQVLLPKVLDLNHVVADIQGLLGRLIGEHIILQTTCDPHLGHVRADPGQIEQVIMNLAVNARDAMPRGGKLIIETANAELDDSYSRTHAPVSPGPYVLLSVSDTGLGMSEAIRNRIFEPFFTTKEAGKGTGLGLATVYGIVKQSSGYIFVYSEPGHGATFKVYLPRVDEPVEVPREARAAHEQARAGETVLLVEDDSELLELSQNYLRASGYTVVAAGSGTEALQWAAQHPEDVHIMVTDVVLPGMNGLELARELTKRRPRMKVLFVSGYSNIEHLDAGAAPGQFELIQKPYRREDLTRRVRVLLDRT